MRDLTKIIQNGELTPKERVSLLVRDFVAKDKDGKAILTPADRGVITDRWGINRNAEVKEYNHYVGAWRTEGSMRIDSQTTYLNAEISLLSVGRIIDYAFWSERGRPKISDRLDELGMGIDRDDALALILANSGLPLGYVVHRIAFESLAEDIRQDLLLIFPDAATEADYLESEEFIAGKKELSREDKEKILDMITVPYTKYAKAFASYGFPMKDWLLQGYFADLPLIEVARRWAERHGIKCEEYQLAEEMSRYADGHGLEINDMFREALSEWLDNGLFISEYRGIWDSGGFATYNGHDTSRSHKEIFRAWVDAKEKAKEQVNSLIKHKKLCVQKKTRTVFGLEEEGEVITGETLYHLDEPLRFSEEYKKQANGLLSFASIVLFARKAVFVKHYASLVGFAEIYRKLETVFEIDLGYRVAGYRAEIETRVGQMNQELRLVAEKMERDSGTEQFMFPIQILLEGMTIDLPKKNNDADEMTSHYSMELKSVIGSV